MGDSRSGSEEGQVDGVASDFAAGRNARRQQPVPSIMLPPPSFQPQPPLGAPMHAVDSGATGLYSPTVAGTQAGHVHPTPTAQTAQRVGGASSPAAAGAGGLSGDEALQEHSPAHHNSKGSRSSKDRGRYVQNSKRAGTEEQERRGRGGDRSSNGTHRVRERASSHARRDVSRRGGRGAEGKSLVRGRGPARGQAAPMHSALPSLPAAGTRHATNFVPHVTPASRRSQHHPHHGDHTARAGPTRDHYPEPSTPHPAGVGSNMQLPPPPVHGSKAGQRSSYYPPPGSRPAAATKGRGMGKAGSGGHARGGAGMPRPDSASGGTTGSKAEGGEGQGGPGGSVIEDKTKQTDGGSRGQGATEGEQPAEKKGQVKEGEAPGGKKEGGGGKQEDIPEEEQVEPTPIVSRFGSRRKVFGRGLGAQKRDPQPAPPPSQQPTPQQQEPQPQQQPLPQGAVAVQQQQQQQAPYPSQPPLLQGPGAAQQQKQQQTPQQQIALQLPQLSEQQVSHEPGLPALHVDMQQQKGSSRHQHSLLNAQEVDFQANPQHNQQQRANPHHHHHQQQQQQQVLDKQPMAALQQLPDPTGALLREPGGLTARIQNPQQEADVGMQTTPEAAEQKGQGSPERGEEDAGTKMDLDLDGGEESLRQASSQGANKGAGQQRRGPTKEPAQQQQQQQQQHEELQQQAAPAHLDEQQGQGQEHDSTHASQPPPPPSTEVPSPPPPPEPSPIARTSPPHQLEHGHATPDSDASRLAELRPLPPPSTHPTEGHHTHTADLHAHPTQPSTAHPAPSSPLPSPPPPPPLPSDSQAPYFVPGPNQPHASAMPQRAPSAVKPARTLSISMQRDLNKQPQLAAGAKPAPRFHPASPSPSHRSHRVQRSYRSTGQRAAGSPPSNKRGRSPSPFPCARTSSHSRSPSREPRLSHSHKRQQVRSHSSSRSPSPPHVHRTRSRSPCFRSPGPRQQQPSPSYSLNPMAVERAAGYRDRPGSTRRDRQRRLRRSSSSIQDDEDDGGAGREQEEGEEDEEDDTGMVTLFVGDLPVSFNSTQLHEVFERFAPGGLRQARVIGDQCYGFVTFKDPLVAQAVVAEVGVGGHGKKIHVQGCDLRVARAEGCTHRWKRDNPPASSLHASHGPGWRGSSRSSTCNDVGSSRQYGRNSREPISPHERGSKGGYGPPRHSHTATAMAHAQVLSRAAAASALALMQQQRQQVGGGAGMGMGLGHLSMAHMGMGMGNWGQAGGGSGGGSTSNNASRHVLSYDDL